jgi:DNA invertase Pin-like site-specific DNA recombinase
VNGQTAKRPFSVEHRYARPGRSDADVRVNGAPERWLVAARLSRVAKKDRERGDDIITGIQTQDTRSTNWVRQEGNVVVHVTRDRNISGAIAPWERPELGPWLTDPVKLVQYDGIVAYDVSRLSREYFDLAWLRKWAEQNHKKLYVIKERLHWPDNRDGTLWGVAAERAYEERQDIIERITRELGALEEAGKLVGRPPFGYVSAGDKYDHYLAPTDEGRTYVPLIYQHCIEGWSLDTIVEWLTAEKVRPAAGFWGERSVAGLIKNPVYIGHRCKREIVPPDETEERDGKVIRYRYGNIWVETPRWQYGRTVHRCEPLVDAAVWKRANDALTNRNKRGHVDPENRAMLAESLLCPFCEDSPMYRHRAQGRKKVYFYYRCAGRGRQRSSCGNEVRVELVNAAVNEIMASTFDVPVMRHEIVYGNEAEIEAELERIRFELKQLAVKELNWEEEDRERALLRAEHERVSNTKLIEDRVELVETDDTYLELWERLNDPERGPWLAEHGFRVTASKERVTVSQGPVSATVELSGPAHPATASDKEPVYQGKCGCGCGTDVYGSRYGSPKKFVDQGHARRAAYLRRGAARER